MYGKPIHDLFRRLSPLLPRAFSHDIRDSHLPDDSVETSEVSVKPDHTKAVNLARRFTAQNENDLMQESLYEEVEEKEAFKKKEYNKDICEELAHHVIQPQYLPKECNKYNEAVQYAATHEKDRTDPTQLLS